MTRSQRHVQMTNKQRAQALGRKCRICGARPGQWCVEISGARYWNQGIHMERRH